jgi:hypothetical protein
MKPHLQTTIQLTHKQVGIQAQAQNIKNLQQQTCVFYNVKS